MYNVSGFGRINKPRYCRRGIRPSVPRHHIRVYRYAYGAVEPQRGESLFQVLPCRDTVCMNVFLCEHSKAYPDDYIILIADGARWHASDGLVVPANIEIIALPPYTLEMNPIEQIWAWLRRHGFRNEILQTLENVVDKLCEIIFSLPADTVKSITHRDRVFTTA